MDCRFILRNDTIELYLLGKLPENETEKFERHIGECESCRSELGKQRVIIAGLQQAGHDAMKAEIGQQAALLKKQPKRFDWNLVYKAAAVLFFLALTPPLVYYSYYYEPPELLQESVAVSPSIEPKLKKTEKTQKDEPAGETGPQSSIKKSKELRSGMDQPVAEAVLEPAVGGVASGSASGGKQAAVRPEVSERIKPVMSEPQMKTEEPGLLADGSEYESSSADEVLSGKGTAGLELAESISDAGNKLSARRSQAQFAGKERQRNSRVMGLIQFQNKSRQIPSSHSKLLFESGRQKVSVVLKSAVNRKIAKMTALLPEVFDVELVKKDSLDLVMSWDFDLNRYALDADSVQVKVITGKLMHVRMGDKGLYEIDLTAEKSTARLLKNDR